MLSVEVKKLTVKYGAFTAVDDISFTVGKGEIFGFLGANGAGKTTTIRVLCGLLIPTAGEVKVAGLDLKKGLEPVKRRVGYMSQKFTLYQDMTVLENLDFTAALHKIPKTVYTHKRGELLDFIGFDSRQNEKRLVRELSGGTKQEVSLVAALLHDPDIVFLDEPTAGVSPAARARFWSLIWKLSKSGKTVFVTTHYMDEAEQCGRIALMRDGRIIALDSPAMLKRKAFPEPLFELTPLVPARGWLPKLKRELSVLDVNPYGMRYHVVVKDGNSFRRFARRMEDNFDSRPIGPSLEDVFIHLVEGRGK
jgi:ABC-2 type transport system ATP-binding protein